MNYEAIFQNPIYSIFEQIDRSKGKPINVSQIALKVAGHVADIFDADVCGNSYIDFDGKSKEVNKISIYQVASFKSCFCTNRVKVLASSFDDAISIAQELFMTKEGRWVAVRIR